MDKSILFALSIPFGILFVGFIRSRQYLSASKKQAKENLGKAAELNLLEEKLGTTVVVMLHCIMPEPAQHTPMKFGYALLAHPEYPDKPVLFQAVFKFGEEVCADGKTRYNVTKDGTFYPSYLKKQ